MDLRYGGKDSIEHKNEDNIDSLREQWASRAGHRKLASEFTYSLKIKQTFTINIVGHGCVTQKRPLSQSQSGPGLGLG